MVKVYLLPCYSAMVHLLAFIFAHGGDPDRNRTCNPLLRRQVLYPVELRDQSGLFISLLRELQMIFK